MSSSERSDSSPGKRRERNNSPVVTKKDTRKLFITNLDGNCQIKELEDELRRLFEKFGTIQNMVVKKNRNSEYSFAFVDMKESSEGVKCVDNLDGEKVAGKPIKVEYQDNNKRRKDSDKGCYTCGKMGHFARECHSSNRIESSRGNRRRSRSRSEDEDRRRKHKRRHHSESSERHRSNSKSKKQRKNRSKDREDKKKRKHKKNYGSSSES